MEIKLRIRDGYWHMDAPYRGADGKKKRLQKSTHVRATEDEALAMEVAAKIYAKVVGNVPLTTDEAKDPKKVTVKMAFDALISDQEASELAEDTISTTKYHAIAIYRFFPEDTLIANVTEQKLRDAVKHYRQTEKLGNLTIVTYLSALNRALVAAGFPRVKPPKIKIKSRSRSRLAPMDQLEILIRYLTPRWRDHLRFYRHTGIRLSEIRLIFPRHVNLEENYVHVEGTKTEGSDRHVPLTDDARAIVVKLLETAEPHKPLFPLWKHPHQSLRRAADRAKIGRISNNDLRRSFATDLLMADESDSKVAALLGHKSTKMVQEHYGKLRKQSGKLHSTVRKLQSFRTGEQPPTETPTEAKASAEPSELPKAAEKLPEAAE